MYLFSSFQQLLQKLVQRQVVMQTKQLQLLEQVLVLLLLAGRHPLAKMDDDSTDPPLPSDS